MEKKRGRVLYNAISRRHYTIQYYFFQLAFDGKIIQAATFRQANCSIIQGKSGMITKRNES